MIIIHLEDLGQDFTEWRCNDLGEVVDAQPFQGWFWVGMKVIGVKSLRGGDVVDYKDKYGRLHTLKYRVKRIEMCNNIRKFPKENEMKLAFDEAFEAIANEKPLKADEVQTKALDRTVWVASNGLPGCLSDHSNVCLTKEDAVQSALQVADTGDGAPRGMATWLRKPGDRTWQHEGCNYRVERMRLRDLL